MQDGIPRGGYRGIVSVTLGAAKIYLAPSSDFKSQLNSSTADFKVDATGALVRRKQRRRAVGERVLVDTAY